MEKFKINFQLFAENWTEDDIALFQSMGLDENGEPIADDDGDNQIGPYNINDEGMPVNPEDDPDNLPNPNNQNNPDEASALSNSVSDGETNLETSTVTEPATEQTPLILGKFKNQAELERAYQEQQNFLGRQSTEIGELRRQLNQTAQPKHPIAGDDIFGGVTNEQLLAAFSKNPKQFLTELIGIANSDTLNKAKQEIRYETEKEKYLKEFFENNPDFSDMKDEFLMISDEVANPEYAINILRGRKLGNLGNLFSDTTYLRKHLDSAGMQEILSDVSIIDKLGEKVVEKIIDNHLKKVKEGQSKVNLMTNDSGNLPKTPPKKYGNFNEMTEDAVSFLKELGKKN